MTEPETRPAELDTWILWFAAGAFFMCYLGTTTLGVVQPTIKGDLGVAITAVRIDRVQSEGELDAAISGYRVGFVIAAAVAVAGFGAAVALIRTKSESSPPATDPA